MYFFQTVIHFAKLFLRQKTSHHFRSQYKNITLRVLFNFLIFYFLFSIAISVSHLLFYLLFSPPKWRLLPCLLAQAGMKYLWHPHNLPALFPGHITTPTPLPACLPPPQPILSTHFLLGTFPENRASQNQICDPFLCYKTLYILYAHICFCLRTQTNITA